MIKLLVMLAFRVVIGVARAESTVLHPLIAVDLVMLMRVDVRGSGVAQSWQRYGKSGDEEQRNVRSNGHRASSGSGGTIGNNVPTMFTDNVNA